MTDYLDQWELRRLRDRPRTAEAWLAEETNWQDRYRSMDPTIRAMNRALSCQISLRSPPAN